MLMRIIDISDNSVVQTIDSIQTPMVNKVKISIDKPHNLHNLNKKYAAMPRERINASYVPERVNILENKDIIDLKVKPLA